MESLKKKIEVSNLELANIKEELGRLRLETKEDLEKRNSIHEQIKELRAEAEDLREKRDALNEKVRDFKRLREEAKEQRREVHSQILKMRREMNILLGRRPHQEMVDIEEKIKKLDWKIQTNPLTLEEEELLVDQVRLLEHQLSIHKQLQKVSTSLSTLYAEEKALKVKAQNYHKELTELAEESRKCHERMLEILEKVRAFRVEADEAHNKYIEAKKRSQKLYQKYA